jgi:hypothetical protein
MIDADIKNFSNSEWFSESEFDFLRNGFFGIQTVNAYYARLLSPFSDLENNLIEIIITKNDNGMFSITDGGETMWLFDDYKADFNAPEFKELVNSILRTYNIEIINNNQLGVKVPKDKVKKSVYLLLYAISEFNYILHEWLKGKV